MRWPVASDPVNATLATSGCSTSGAPTSGAEPGDDVDDARREAGLLDQLHELERRRRGELRRLDDDRVAGGERGRELPRQQQQRRVPRHDRRDDAERLVARVVERVGLVGRAGPRLRSCRPARRSSGTTAPCTPSARSSRRTACRCRALRSRPAPSTRSVIRSPSRRSSAPRRDAVSAGHSPDVNARCAARTARSTSSAVPRGMSAQGVARNGSSLSKWSRELASTHCPPMNI